jgi:hypothetical protein
MGLLRSAYEAVFNKTPNILPPSKSAADYDLVVLGCPVWGEKMASPMRTYIARERRGLPQVALLCTVGAVGGRAALREMAALCGRAPIASLALTEKDLSSPTLGDRIDAFARKARAAWERQAGEPRVIPAVAQGGQR